MTGPLTATRFIGDGEQYAYIVEPPHDEQLAKMELQVQEDQCRQEHQEEEHASGIS